MDVLFVREKVEPLEETVEHSKRGKETGEHQIQNIYLCPFSCLWKAELKVYLKASKKLINEELYMFIWKSLKFDNVVEIRSHQVGHKISRETETVL